VERPAATGQRVERPAATGQRVERPAAAGQRWGARPWLVRGGAPGRGRSKMERPGAAGQKMARAQSRQMRITAMAPATRPTP